MAYIFKEVTEKDYNLVPCKEGNNLVICQFCFTSSLFTLQPSPQ